MNSAIQTKTKLSESDNTQSLFPVLWAIGTIMLTLACNSVGTVENGDDNGKVNEGEKGVAAPILEPNDLKDFKSAAVVNGSLEIDCPLCVSYKELAGVTRIEGDLIIRNAESYSDWSALQSLVEVTGDVVIEDSEFKNGLEALDNLKEVGGKVVMQYCSFGPSAPAELFPSLLHAGGIDIGNLMPIESDSLSAFSGFQQVTSVSGSVKIDFIDADQVNVFERLVKTDGDVTIRSLNKTSAFSGFSSMQTIGGKLIISENRGVVEMNCFNSLQRVEGEVNINDNERITNLDSFSSLTYVGGRLAVQLNMALQQIEGLGNLTSVYGLLLMMGDPFNGRYPFDGISSLEGSLDIAWNGSDEALSGFSNITRIGGKLRLRGCSSLTDLSEFANLKSIGGGLEIRYNEALTSLHGLEGLQTLSGDLNINENHVLTDISAISHITSVGAAVDISDNFELAYCDICSFLQNLSSTPESILTIENLSDECYSNANRGCELQ